MSKVNRSLTSYIWGKVGHVALAILDVYARRIKYFSGVYHEMKLNNISNSSRQSRLASVSDSALLKTHKERTFFAAFKMDINRLEKTFSKKGLVQLEELFKCSEVELIECLLNFLLCVALCCCEEFIDIKPKDSSKHGNKSTSYSKNSRTDMKDNSKNSNHVQACSLSRHISSKAQGHRKPSNLDPLKTQENIECRKLRKHLYQAGIFSSVCPFLTADNDSIQVS